MVESRRFPATVWAIALGLAVIAAGSVPWSALAALNVRYGASFPWASVAMAVYLYAFLKYLQGSGPPVSTTATRRRLLRARGLTHLEWRWALVAGGSANAALAAVFILVSRFGWIHHGPIRLPVAPWWTIAAWLLTSAAVAGIVEESGFRGYMQKLLEERFRPAAAIAIASVIFGAIHLSHGLSLAILFDAAWGAVYGVLAYLTGSILPSIVLHSSLDALEFFLAWRFAVGRFAGVPAPPVVTLDSPAWFALGGAAVLSILAVWSFRRLSRLHHSHA